MTKILYIVSVLIGVVAFALGAEPPPPSTVTLDIWNPMPISVSTIVKCDYSDDLHRFKFERTFIIKPHRITRLRLPREHQHCQVWPSLGSRD